MKRSLFALDEKFIERSKQVNPDDWGTSQPHNAYYETPRALRWVVGHKTRLESGQITKKINFHESWKYSPTYGALTHKDYMIARDKLPFTDLKYAPMNAFETDCKNRWKQNLGVCPFLCRGLGKAPLSDAEHRILWEGSRTILGSSSQAD